MQAIGEGAVVVCSIARFGRGRSGIARGSRLAVGLSSAVCGWLADGLGEELVEAAGGVSLEGAQRAFGGLAFGCFCAPGTRWSLDRVGRG